MYKKALVVLSCVYLAMFAGILFLTKDVGSRSEEQEGEIKVCGQVEQMGIVEYSSSGRRVLNYLMLEYPEEEEDSPESGGEKYGFSGEEIEVLQRIVEAEAGCEDEEGKLLVANVVLNRVKDEAFPDTISDVVFQKDGKVTQFSPVASGSIYQVEISEETVAAVNRALEGEDISEGALYFAARKYASKKNMKWFDENLTFLFRHGGHEFFR